MKRLLFILIFISLSFELLSEKEKNTNWILKAGLYGNANIHIADFDGLPGFTVQDVNYGSSLGFGYSFMIGGEYLFYENINGIKDLYSFELKYQGLSANFSKERLLGYDIEQSDYTEIYADFILEPSINAIITEQTYKSYLFSNLPLAIEAGVWFGIPLNNTFTQTTKLTKPSDVTFENGSRTDDDFSGDIPDATSFYYGLTAGMSYDAFKTGNILISPEIQFNYGLNKIVSDLDWSISNIQAGVSIAYNVPEAKIPPPAKPPMPALEELPIAPKVKPVIVNIQIFENENQINKIDYKYQVNEYYKRDVYIPVIFVEQNTKGYISSYDEDRIIELTAEKLNTSNNKLNIFATIDNEEDKTKVENIKNRLIDKGISEDNIKIKYNKVAENFKYPELEEEALSVIFDFTDKSMLLTDEYLLRTQEVLSDKEIKINIEIDYDNKYNFNSYAEINGKTIELQEGNNNINLKEYLNTDIKNNKLEVTAIAENEWNKKTKESKTLIINTNKTVNRFTNYNQNNNQSLFTLGFFEFDGKEFISYDEKVINLVKESIKDGKKVKIISLTDNLGIKSYNRKLAEIRADKALELLNIEKNDVIIEIKENGIHRNDSPYGRMLNRAVMIEIKK